MQTITYTGIVNTTIVKIIFCASYDHRVYYSPCIESQKPSNVTAVMPLIPTGYDAAGSLNVTLEWDDESDPMHLGHSNQISNYYTVTIYPEAANLGSIFHTANTYITLALHYDQNYNINISVVASNCVGNSTPAQIHIRLGKLQPLHACMHVYKGIQCD